jgi:hypothetical protein
MNDTAHLKSRWQGLRIFVAAWLRRRADALSPPAKAPEPIPPPPVRPPEPLVPAPVLVQPPLPPVSPPSPLDNKPWLDVTEECVALFDEFDQLSGQFEEERRELCEHVCARLRELLERSGVEVIEADGPFDRRIHQPIKRTAISDQTPPNVHVVSPGFKIDRRVFRRARVEIVQA